jgi:hypothetical protein
MDAVLERLERMIELESLYHWANDRGLVVEPMASVSGFCATGDLQEAHLVGYQALQQGFRIKVFPCAGSACWVPGQEVVLYVYMD